MPSKNLPQPAMKSVSPGQRKKVGKGVLEKKRERGIYIEKKGERRGEEERKAKMKKRGEKKVCTINILSQRERYT